jgi:hypothetical protein
MTGDHPKQGRSVRGSFRVLSLNTGAVGCSNADVLTETTTKPSQTCFTELSVQRALARGVPRSGSPLAAGRL